LMKCGDETPLKGISARNSGSRFQIIIFESNYFIQINNFSGNKNILPDIIKFAQFLTSPIHKGEPVKLFKYLAKKNIVLGSEKIIRGSYALEPIYTFGQGDILKLGGKIFAVIGDYKIGVDEFFTQIFIPYPNDKLACKVFENLIENLDPYLEILHQQNDNFVFKDYQNKYGIVEIKKNLMKIKIHLNSKP